MFADPTSDSDTAIKLDCNCMTNYIYRATRKKLSRSRNENVHIHIHFTIPNVRIGTNRLHCPCSSVEILNCAVIRSYRPRHLGVISSQTRPVSNGHEFEWRLITWWKQIVQDNGQDSILQYDFEMYDWPIYEGISCGALRGASHIAW